MKKQIFWLITWLTALPLLGACGGVMAHPVAPSLPAPETVEETAALLPETAPVAQQPRKYGLIAGEANDRGFNQLALAGLEATSTELLVEVNHLVTLTPEEAPANIAQLLDEEYNGIISLGFGLAGSVKAASEANPAVPFVNIDFPSQTEDDLGVLFATDEPAFLAGYLAAGMSQSGVVCTYGGSPIPTVLIFMVGFEHGVTHYNEQNGTTVQLLGWETDPDVPQGGNGIFAGNFNNADDGRAIAQNFFNQGCDVIFPVAGAVGLGSAQLAQEQGVMVVGVDADQAESVPELTDVYLTSVVKRIDKAVSKGIQLIEAGLFEGGENFIATLENGGVGLAPFHTYEGQISAQMQSDLAQISQDIIDGTLSTGWPISAGEVQRLTMADLQNAVYPVEYVENGRVRLVLGQYQGPAAAGSTTEVRVQLNQATFGDLDGDGFADAAVILASDAGGNGTIYDLVTVLDRRGKPVSITSTPLGTRIELDSLDIKKGDIVVMILAHATGDPQCCPTQEMPRTFNLAFSLAETTP